jgi:hypothetical protein
MSRTESFSLDLFVDHRDNVWVVGNGHVALKFTRAGKFLLQIGELWKTGGSNDTRLLGNPTSGTVDAKTNEVFISDGYANRRVIVFDATTGEYKRHWGAYGGKPEDGPMETFDPNSAFGTVPAAVMGLDVPRFLHATEEMVHACGAGVPAAENPGVVLGAVLGVLARRGRDKVTLITSPGIADFGAWLEQLLAESTGKSGKGLIPVDGETVGAPGVYGDDRVFVYVRLESAPDASQDRAVEGLERAGQPVVRIAVDEPYTIGEEFFRWEIATAVAGSIIGINAFNQPDVEASKIATRRLTEEFERSGALPREEPFFQSDGIALFADAANAAALMSASADRTLAGYVSAHLGRLAPGDYFALLAYIEMNAAHARALQAMRHAVRDARRVATCVGFGPRFLHSTGQAYKGGPDTGVFLQITCDDAVDLPVPGQKYTFGLVKSAQARGDFQVLAERGRRALRVHLGDVETGVTALENAIRGAL